ncbi:MAG: hypothetical protein JXR10_17600 [Cyclobacteriaceae bacterium]
MTYELVQLDQVIRVDLNPLKFANNPLQSSHYDHWLANLNTEVTRIKNAFIVAVFGSQPDQLVERYIQFHQSKIIGLIDHLLDYLSPEEAISIYEHDDLKSIVNLYKQAYTILEDLLSYLEKHFSKYFNQDTKIPKSYASIAARDFRELMLDIEYSLANSLLTVDVVRNVLDPLQNFIQYHDTKETTFREIIYYKLLLQKLHGMNPVPEKPDEAQLEFMCSMIYLNFNSFKFFGQCTEYIKAKYQDKDNLTDQLEALAWCAKTINQCQQKPDVAFRPNRDALKSSLTSWIEEEMAYLEKKKQLSLNLPFDKLEGLTNDFKINTSLSVAQLAYLIRILLEEKVLINRNQSEVLKFFAQFTRTKKAENVSAESLRTRYYNVDAFTKEAVKDITIKLLNNIRKKT